MKLLRGALRAIAMFVFACLALTGPAKATPLQVVTGVYVNQIYNVSLKDNRFTADFYIWFRYEGDDIKPIETMEVINGKIDSKSGLVTKKIRGVTYSLCRVVATINKFWDVSRYPLDKHTIEIEIEDSANDADVMVLTPDSENVGMSPDM